MSWLRDGGDRRRGLRQNVEQPTSNAQLRREVAVRMRWLRGGGDRAARFAAERRTANVQRPTSKGRGGEDECGCGMMETGGAVCGRTSNSQRPTPNFEGKRRRG